MLFLIASLAFAEPVKVGIEEGFPYAYQEDGIWEGTSVYYWEEAAQRAKISYEYVEIDFKDAFTQLEAKEIDVYIPAVTVTSERETKIDFSFPYAEDSLGFAQKNLTSLWSPDLWLMIWLALAAIIFAAIIFAAAEGGRTSVFNGLYWAITTASTTGYGDITPKTASGKVVAMLWMLCGCLLYSFTAGTIIVSMQEEKTIIQSNLPEVTVIHGTTSEAFARDKHLKYKLVETQAQLFTAYDQGESILYDISLLGDRNYKRVENTKQPYAFAFPSQSPLREPINIALLQVLDNSPPGVN